MHLYGDDAGKGRDDERYCSKHIVNFATAKEAAVESKGAAREVASAMEAVMAAKDRELVVLVWILVLHAVMLRERAVEYVWIGRCAVVVVACWGLLRGGVRGMGAGAWAAEWGVAREGERVVLVAAAVVVVVVMVVVVVGVEAIMEVSVGGSGWRR